METILPGAPWLIAHRSMLGINKPQKISLNGQDYVLWQNQQGQVFALNNICPLLVYANFKHSIFKPLLRRSMLSAVTIVVEQDTRAIETSYLRQPTLIRLPNEEIMFHAQKLYHEWGKSPINN